MTPLLEAFGRVRASRGAAPLIWLPGTGEHLSADALWHGATSLADEFREASVPAGAAVALTSGNHPATFIAWLAARLADVTLVPVDRSAPREELDSLAAEFGLCAVVGPPGTLYPTLATPVCVGFRCWRGRCPIEFVSIPGPPLSN